MTLPSDADRISFTATFGTRGRTSEPSSAHVKAFSHWTEIDSDPNSAALQKRRRAQLSQVHALPVMDRIETIASLCKDKVVLNLGCVDQVGEGLPLAPLHRRLSEVAKRCVGVDVVEDQVQSLRDEGYEVLVADATSPDLADAAKGPFDVVVAGEIIEHVLNVGGLLSASRSVLSPSGVMIVTTPNPDAVVIGLNNMLGRYAGNVDHVASFSPYEMIEIADRTGFQLTAWYGEWKRGRGKRIVLLQLAHYFARLRSLSSLDCTTLIYHLAPVESC